MKCTNNIPENTAALPLNVKRVLFLGDSITYAGQYSAYVETYFITRYPDSKIEFINVGLPSETVSGLSEDNHADGAFPRPDLQERLHRVLEQTKPDLIFACYGMNDGIYQPFADDRFKAFQDGMQRLRSAAAAANAEIIHLTPPYFDGEKNNDKAYMKVLERYSQWLLEQRANGWTVIDVHGPMTDHINARHQTEPAFAYAQDGIHPDDYGHWIIAKHILLGLGAQDITDADSARQMAAVNPNGSAIIVLVQQREEMMRDAWLTATGHQRPGLNKGLPLDEAKTKARMMNMS